MRRKSIIKHVSITLALLLPLIEIGIQPAHATNFGGAQGYVSAENIAGSSFTGMLATLTITNPYNDIAPDGAKNSHWIGIQSDFGPHPGHLVQAGGGWNHQLTSFTFGFFYEFYPDQSPVDITSWVLNTWAANCSCSTSIIVGDQVFYKLWYSTTDRWGLQVQDVSRTNWNASEYIHCIGCAANYINNEGIVDTEKDPYNDLLNDGQLTIKHPMVSMSGNLYWFTDPIMQQFNGDLKDPDGDGHTLEQCGVVDSNEYAYQTWKLYD